MELHTGTPPTPMPSPEPTIDTIPLTPSEQIALLTLRSYNTLARDLLAILRRSTARAGVSDYRAIERMGYAIRKPNKPLFHELTPRGIYKTTQIMRELGQHFGITAAKPVATPKKQRGIFQPGSWSQNGNW